MNTLGIRARNVGGIDELTLELDGQTNVVSGRNASNKTSLLESIAFGLGARSVPIRSGADEASVELTYDGTTVERRAQRTRDGTRRLGDGWIEGDDALLLERFGSLLETNELRVAVATGGDVEALLKEPMDIEAIEREQSRVMDRRRRLEGELDELDDVDQRLSTKRDALEEQRGHLTDLEDRLAALRREQESGATDDELGELRDRRADLRTKREQYERQRENAAEAVSRLEDDRAELVEEITEAEAAAAEYDPGALKRERDRIRSDLDDVTRRIEVLQSVLTSNREMIGSGFTGALGRDSGVMGDEVTCWACGQRAGPDHFEETVDQLQGLIADDKRRVKDREPEIEELTRRIEAAEEARSDLERLQSRKRDVEDRLESRRDSLEETKNQLESVRGEIEALDDEIADVKATRNDEQADVATEIEETRVELGTLRRDVERLEAACETLREKRVERDRKRERVEELTEEIRELTDRIENLETELRETFNDAMDDLIELLEFERIDRVWLDGDFDLVVVREVDGTTRRDGLEHLAESEREMIGLVLGLAGYVAFDVAEVTPVLLLDSLGAFDAERTERLIDYFAERTEVLVAAVHPEMAAEFDFETITFETPTTV
ncbi:archaea-specific SMC-related protein [Halomarina halobia]|uniref:DNA repair protein RecN n=1 Tax=Halomarina halobia TaxID=3033386 RepID=A0ABD6AE94_9EURY|nr:archaea-specific SMC-related protein [Halomarina sp. PSR21]